MNFTDSGIIKLQKQMNELKIWMKGDLGMLKDLTGIRFRGANFDTLTDVLFLV